MRQQEAAIPAVHRTKTIPLEGLCQKIGGNSLRDTSLTRRPSLKRSTSEIEVLLRVQDLGCDTKAVAQENHLRNRSSSASPSTPWCPQRFNGRPMRGPREHFLCQSASSASVTEVPKPIRKWRSCADSHLAALQAIPEQAALRNQSSVRIQDLSEIGGLEPPTPKGMQFYFSALIS